MAITDISDRKKFLAQGNVYLPHIAIIEKIIDETPGVRTFHFNFKDEKLREEFTFGPGQFGEYSVLGIGEYWSITAYIDITNIASPTFADTALHPLF